MMTQFQALQWLAGSRRSELSSDEERRAFLRERMAPEAFACLMAHLRNTMRRHPYKLPIDDRQLASTSLQVIKVSEDA